MTGFYLKWRRTRDCLRLLHEPCPSGCSQARIHDCLSWQSFEPLVLTPQPDHPFQISSRFHPQRSESTEVYIKYSEGVNFDKGGMVTEFQKDGGGQGIRTLEGVAPLHAFQACAFDHSANPPQTKMFITSQLGLQVLVSSIIEEI